MSADPRILRPRLKTFANLVEERLRERLGEQRARGLEFTADGDHAVLVKVPGGVLRAAFFRALVTPHLEGFQWYVALDGRIRVSRPLPYTGPRGFTLHMGGGERHGAA